MNTGILSPLKVYYGWAALNKIRKDPAISVLFENELTYNEDRKMNTIRRLQNTCYVRQQTIEEAEDGKLQNRILTEYTIFLYKKPVCGDLDTLLELNYQKDINNVSQPVLDEIREALRKSFVKPKLQGRAQV